MMPLLLKNPFGLALMTRGIYVEVIKSAVMVAEGAVATTISRGSLPFGFFFNLKITAGGSFSPAAV